MYLPKSKYSAPKHTPGGEFILNNQVYVGWYIKTFKNQYFTGRSLTKESKILIKLDQEDGFVTDQNLNNSTRFASMKVAPSKIDTQNGKWTRYFLQDSRTLKIIEVDRNKAIFFKRKSYIKQAKIDWNIKGPAENVTSGQYTYYGAAYQNRVAVEKLESTIKGITNFIKDYSEFVE